MLCAMEKVNGGVCVCIVKQFTLTSVVVVVEAQVGRIWAESAGRNRAAIFIFSLPVAS